jgi:hypothetical protein
METTTLLLANGDALDIAGSPERVAKLLEDATRSSAGTLAWLESANDEERFGVNPAQVVWIRRGRD